MIKVRETENRMVAGGRGAENIPEPEGGDAVQGPEGTPILQTATAGNL